MFKFDGLNGVELYKNLKRKNLNELSIEELAYTHLEYSTFTCLKNCNVISSLYELKETLSVSFMHRATSKYVPLMVSFSILDQIGSLYYVTNNEPKYENGIRRALASFSDFPTCDINTLVTIRNGLLHDGSLLSIDERKSIKVCFRMIEGSCQVITQPKKTWDGEYRDDLSEYLTLIDLNELKKLVLSFIDKCREYLLADELTISIRDTKEFYYKFLFINGS